VHLHILRLPKSLFVVYSSDCFAGKRIKNIYILGGTKTHGDHHLLRPFYRLIGKLRYWLFFLFLNFSLVGSVLF